MNIHMSHSHIDGWNSLEAYRFAERVIAGKRPLIQLKSEPTGFGELALDIEIPEDFEDVTAELFYLTEPLQYDKNNNVNQTWQSIKPELKGARVIGNVPAETCCYFVELMGHVNGVTYITSSAMVQK